MNNRFFTIGIILFLFQIHLPDVSGTEFNQESIKQLLQESVQVSISVPYRGVITYKRVNDEENWSIQFEILRTAPNIKKITLLEPRSVKGIVLLQNQEGIWITPINQDMKERIESERRSFLWEWLFHSRESIGFEDLSALMNNYHVTVKQNASVADQDAYMVAINPKYQRRPALRLHIDKQTKMQLKYERLDRHGNPLESFQFNSIEYHPAYEEHELSTDGMEAKYKEPDFPDPPKNIALDFTPFTTECLPDGFQKIKETHWQGRERTILHTLYSDGLARMSVIQRKLGAEEIKKSLENPEPDDKPVVKKYERQGRTVFFRELDGVKIAIVGDVSSREIIRALTNMSRTEE
ncbi:MAG: sigma-E factor regulatory protein RseB domain-containing protein [bacterium]